ncbi:MULTISPECIES: HupE/UreJ family protein [unclassified Mesobacillus]|uniref:HupE/UreJ family protein n=1 Tax=unclassified Mesobacillus TaxID=2675270 RepID=UPI00203B6694|nr:MULTISPECIES: HupE/UreJ family protein [unclassified Mesobacillus]MCM3124192.1 HupE/UreJ family protein [Mesobacillus sp. MER 33]MCM3234041.1 HupE/UreJ family protein [Mesobacillus sp. MER 48]
MKAASGKNKIKVFFYFLLLFIFTINSFPSLASAHPYSASFTTIEFNEQETKFEFSIDTLSILELQEDIDQNKDQILQEKEIAEDQDHLVEFLTHSVILDKNNEQQEPVLTDIKINKKDNKEFLTLSLKYPPYQAGDTITIDDGLYGNDSNTNYVNLLTASFNGESSQAALQGENRSWTILLTEDQQEQQASGEQNSQSTPTQETKPEAQTSSSWLSFFQLGMSHILTGYDHLLFLFALLLKKQTFKQYALIVTSFTVAHSITLSLAVLGIMDLPSRFVESFIALSIIYVAAENIFKKEVNHRWGLTFLFGLIHGLGFANILQEMNLSKANLASALISFNIGIEVVQLVIVLLLLPLLSYLHRLKASSKIIKYGSIVIILLGMYWLIQRLFS